MKLKGVEKILGACPARFTAVYRRSGELTKYEKRKEPKSKN